MKKILTTSLLLLSSIAQADVIKCTFSEPFVDTTYSTSQSTLTYKDYEGKTKVVKNVSFQIKSARVFELVSKNGKVLQTLTLDNEGSNGGSDTVYPYSVKDISLVDAGAANGGAGGCVSNHLKATEPQQ